MFVRDKAKRYASNTQFMYFVVDYKNGNHSPMDQPYVLYVEENNLLALQYLDISTRMS